MPALSPTMEKGNIAKWLLKIGDEVKPGDAMADVETDKATVAFESVEAGYIAKILVGDGSNDIIVGTPVAVLAENKEDVEKFADFTGDGSGSAAPAAAESKPEKAAEPEAAKQTSAAPQSSSDSSSGARVIASPAAKRIANEKGVSLQGLKGTGPDGRIVAADVNEASERAPAQAAATQAAPKQAAPAAKPSAPAAGEYVDIPHTQIRKVIASRLLQSKQNIPHYYLTAQCTVDALNTVRAQLNEQAGKDGVKLSVNDFIVKAAALACRKVPEVNSSWMDNAIREYSYVDMSIAVSTESGLITPVVKDADIKGLQTISAETKSLAKKARDNKLKPEEYQGGTFTISNLGMFGVHEFSAIINPPQAAILAIGTTEKKVVEVSEGQFKSTSVMNVTMSCDHRVVDGAVGAKWLQAFKGFIENPITMIL